MESQNNDNISENLIYSYDNVTLSTNSDFLLLIFLDRSQQVMTIVGLIANVGTSITLIKNGQVSASLKWTGKCFIKMDR